MAEQPEKQTQSFLKNPYLWLFLLVLAVVAIFFLKPKWEKQQVPIHNENSAVKSADIVAPATPLVLDKAAYDKKLLQIANLPTSTASSTKPRLWPAKAVYPNGGALLPFNRIVAYYGNLYSKNMGVLGEYPEYIMLDKLSSEVKKWQEADPSTPVIPAIHYIAVVAQAGPGKDGMYRARMPDKEIDKALALAQKVNGIVFLDVQIGLSNVQAEVPLLEKYLKLPNVHLGIDPEFAMHDGARPGTKIGTLDGSDINFAAEYLSKIVKDNNLPPKILIVHRFTRPMLTSATSIHPLPEVQIVMNMDGFGGQPNKINTYKSFIYPEPVQFTGFKLFYHNDSARGPMLTPEQLLKLTPIPVYIQYQ